MQVKRSFIGSITECNKLITSLKAKVIHEKQFVSVFTVQSELKIYEYCERDLIEITCNDLGEFSSEEQRILNFHNEYN